MSFVTVMALIYTHMQMQIFDLGYQGSRNEKLIHELRDSNGLLTHQILALKSSNHLGNQLLDRGHNNLQFMSSDQILTLTGPASMVNHLPTAAKNKSENIFWNFLSFLAPQDAKAWDESINR